MSTGPLPPGITLELEALKRRLADMTASEMSAEETEAMAVEISAIRLQLRRIALDQQGVQAQLHPR